MLSPRKDTTIRGEVAADFSLRFDLTQAKACGYHQIYII